MLHNAPAIPILKRLAETFSAWMISDDSRPTDSTNNCNNRLDKNSVCDKLSPKSLLLSAAQFPTGSTVQPVPGIMQLEQNQKEDKPRVYGYESLPLTSTSDFELFGKGSTSSITLNTRLMDRSSSSNTSATEPLIRITGSKERLLPPKGHIVSFPYDSGKKFTFYGQNRTTLFQTDSLDDLNAELGTTEGTASGAAQERGLVWIDVCSAPDFELEMLAQLFQIHPLSIEDIQEGDSETREKFEIYQNYLFFATKCIREPIPKLGYWNLEYTTLFIILFDTFVLSFHRSPLASIHTVLRRVHAIKSSGVQMTSEWVLYSLLDATTDEYKPTVTNVQTRVDSIEETILGNFSLSTQSASPDPLICGIASAKRAVTRLNRLLLPKVEMLNGLLRKGQTRFQDYTLLYMRDILDHALRMIQRLDTFGESLERSHNNYLAQINIQLGETSNQLNLVMKKMTACTIVIMPLNLIASIWGMNVAVPGYGPGGNYWPFFAILVFMMFAVFVTAAVSKRFHWF